MATIYATPEGYDAPTIDAYFVDGKFDLEEMKRVEDEFIDNLRQWCKDHGNGPLCGEIYRHNVADGFAQYMVFAHKPRFSLIFMPLGDAYQLPEAHERGLRVSDVKRSIAFRNLFAEL
jgi:hypothetical protein